MTYLPSSANIEADLGPGKVVGSTQDSTRFEPENGSSDAQVSYNSF